MSSQRRVAILIGLLAFSWSLRASAKVVISEVQWMGTDLSTADEWIEIACITPSEGSEECPVGNWTLTSLNAKNEEAVIARFATGAVIGSGKYVVIANAGASASRLEANPWIITSAISLPNSKLLLRLRSATGTLMDAVDDGVGAPFAGLSKVKAGSGSGLGSGRLIWASMERVSLSASGQTKTNWRSARTFIGFDDGAPLFGTPGFPNGSGPSLDLSPPFDATDLEAWTSSGSLFVLWSPSRSLDVRSQILTAGTGSIVLPPSASGWTLGGCTDASGSIVLPQCFSGSLISLRSEDLLLNTYSGSTTRVQPYRKSIKNEHNNSSASSCAPFDASLVVQSGKTVSEGKLTINVQATATGISLTKLRCHIDFSDGFRVDRCNPGSHTFTEPGIHTITLIARDQCDNTVKRWIDIEVLRKQNEEIKEADETDDLCRASGSGTSALVISEIFPNPSGDEEAGEWIELQNRSPVTVSLCGWGIADLVSLNKPHMLSGADLLPGAFHRISRSESGIALNNDEETLHVLQRTKSGSSVYQKLAYSRAPENQSYALDEYDVYRWSTLTTPGSGNILPTVNFAVRMEPASGILQAGSGVSVRLVTTSGSTYEYAEPLHKPYFISLNSGSYLPSLGSLIVDSETVVRAFALIGGLRTPIVEERYEIMRDIYESSVYISEISPKSGVCMSHSTVSPESEEPQGLQPACPEWIELYNPGHEEASLSGWIIDDVSDAGSKPYALPFGFHMGSGSYSILYGSLLRISLNDDGDAVRLIDPAGIVHDEVIYPKIQKRRTYARGRAWCLATPTPLAANRCDYPSSSSAPSSKKRMSSATSFITVKQLPMNIFSSSVSSSDSSARMMMRGEILSKNHSASVVDDIVVAALLASMGVAVIYLVRPKP